MKQKSKSKFILLKFILSILILFGFWGTLSCTYNEPSAGSDSEYNYNSSYSLTINSYNWLLTGEVGHWYCRFSIPEITQLVINSGAVLVYYWNSNDYLVALPYSTTLYNYWGEQFAEEIWAEISLRTLDIHYVYTDPRNMTPRYPLDIKVVVLR